MGGKPLIHSGEGTPRGSVERRVVRAMRPMEPAKGEQLPLEGQGASGGRLWG